MKLKALYDSNLNLIKIPCILKSPHKRIATDFIIDTGSPSTLLNYTDSIRMNIPFVQKSKMIRMGGHIYQSYDSEKIEIVFKSDNGELINIKIPIKIIRPNSMKMDKIEELDSFPNILGLDFFKDNYKFFCNLSQSEAYFEK